MATNGRKSATAEQLAAMLSCALFAVACPEPFARVAQLCARGSEPAFSETFAPAVRAMAVMIDEVAGILQAQVAVERSKRDGEG